MANKNKPRTGFRLVFHSIFWTLLFAVAVHIVYAIWPWPEYRGAKVLEEVLNAEWGSLAPLMNQDFLGLVEAVFNWAYKVFFVFTGLDYLVSTALSAEKIESTGGEGMRSLVLVAWKYFIEPFYFSLQLIVLRSITLISLSPLFFAAGFAGFINGYVGRYLRRTGGGKESGFIYHRGKIWWWLALWGIWPVYLIPPMNINLSLLLLPFLVAVLALTWLVSHWFKKQL